MTPEMQKITDIVTAPGTLQNAVVALVRELTTLVRKSIKSPTKVKAILDEYEKESAQWGAALEANMKSNSTPPTNS